MAKLRPSKNKITLGTAIAMTVLCLVLGTVFLLNHTYWERPVEKDEAVQVSAIYKSYYYKEGIQGTRYSRSAVLKLYFKDNDTLFFNDCYIDTELVEKIDALPEGTRLDMLLHPNGDDIIECKAEGETLLDFEWATSRLLINSVGFVVIGICLYAIGAYFIYHTIRLTRWRLKLNKSNKQS